MPPHFVYDCPPRFALPPPELYALSRNPRFALLTLKRCALSRNPRFALLTPKRYALSCNPRYALPYPERVALSFLLPAHYTAMFSQILTFNISLANLTHNFNISLAPPLHLPCKFFARFFWQFETFLIYLHRPFYNSHV